jgi:hypothetical protein
MEWFLSYHKREESEKTHDSLHELALFPILSLHNVGTMLGVSNAELVSTAQSEMPAMDQPWNLTRDPCSMFSAQHFEVELPCRSAFHLLAPLRGRRYHLGHQLAVSITYTRRTGVCTSPAHALISAERWRGKYAVLLGRTNR